MTWFANTTILFDEDQTPCLVAPNEFAKNWIERKYFHGISERVRNKWQKELQLKTCNEPLQAKTLKMTQEKSLKASAPIQHQRQIPNHFSFNRYISGEENKLAITAAKMLPENNDAYHSPFMIVGAHGLGKTHLATAIAGEYAYHECVLLHAEEFGNEFIISAKEGKLEAFRATLRSKKVFIIEDLDFFLEGVKKKTVDELINTLKVLRRDERLIVVTSTRPIADYRIVSPKLCDLLLSGLKIRLKEPSSQTRLQYIKEFTKRHRTRFSEKAISFIEAIPFKSIRELDGALKQLVAYSIVEKDKLPISVVREVLSDHIREHMDSDDPALGQDLHTVAKIVCQNFGVSFAKLTSKTRDRHISLARHVAMCISYNEIHSTLKEIGHFYGGKQHQSVLYGVQKIQEKRKKDLEFRKIYDKICLKIKTQQSM